MSQPRFKVREGSASRPSIFASRSTLIIEDLLDPPHTITICKLPGRHLERASQENTFTSVDTLKRLGGPAFQKELAAVGDKEQQAKAVAERQADPLNGFDAYVLLRFGVQSWTYTHEDGTRVSLAPENVIEESGVSVSRVKALDDLEADIVECWARFILRLSKPSLFVDAAAAAVMEKNVSSTSTAT